MAHITDTVSLRLPVPLKNRTSASGETRRNRPANTSGASLGRFNKKLSNTESSQLRTDERGRGIASVGLDSQAPFSRTH